MTAPASPGPIQAPASLAPLPQVTVTSGPVSSERGCPDRGSSDLSASDGNRSDGDCSDTFCDGADGIEVGKAAPVLVFDGGCPFCSHFAALSALRSGIAGLQIRDGRSDTALRLALARRGYHLRDGAMVIDGDTVWHGAEAIQWLCARMQPDAALLQLLAALFRDQRRARGLYPWLLQARRLALAWRGLSPDPDAAAPGSAGPVPVTGCPSDR